MRTVVVVDYDPTWPELFERLRSAIWPAVCDIASSVEHVGSTSVPGLAAKPIIDMSVVVPTEADIPVAIARVATLGYVHRGNLGVEGREAFAAPARLPAHHLYVCLKDGLGLVNQLAVRDYLRAHSDDAQEYADLKKRLARQFPNDIDGYVNGKTDFVLRILRNVGLASELVEAIERANRKSV
jgi:GrpB-like predicted nucleotidyltransferase (UPF0157 family)